MIPAAKGLHHEFREAVRTPLVPVAVGHPALLEFGGVQFCKGLSAIDQLGSEDLGKCLTLFGIGIVREMNDKDGQVLYSQIMGHGFDQLLLVLLEPVSPRARVARPRLGRSQQPFFRPSVEKRFKRSAEL